MGPYRLNREADLARIARLQMMVAAIASLGILAACTSVRETAPGEGAPKTSENVAAPAPIATAAASYVVQPIEVVDRVSAQRTETRIQFADGLTALGTSLFAKTDDGRVVRVDTASAAVTGEVRVDTTNDPARYCMGIGTDGEALYACSTGDESTSVVRVDPGTLEVLDTLDADMLFDQVTLPWAAGHLWVLTGAGDYLLGMDSKSGTVEIPLAVRCANVAASEDALYLACPTANEVLKVDPDSGEVVGRVGLENPRVIAWGGTSVWAGVRDGVLQLSAELEPLAHFTGITTGLEGDLAADGDRAWVRTAGGFLHLLDAATGQAPVQIASTPSVGGGSVIIADGSVWTTSYDEGLLMSFEAR